MDEKSRRGTSSLVAAMNGGGGGSEWWEGAGGKERVWLYLERLGLWVEPCQPATP